MKMPPLRLARAIVVLIAVGAGGDAAGLKIGANAPRFTLQDQEGRNVTLDGLLGKTVVLEWFDPECDYTKRDIAVAKTPQKLAERYKDKGVVWLGVNSTRSGSKEKDKAWVKENELPYAVLDDAKQDLARAYGIGVVPRYVIVDKNGSVAYVGSIDDDESRNGVKREGKINFIDRALEELTAGKAVTKPQGLEYGCPLR
jgi:peroxiredoxin